MGKLFLFLAIMLFWFMFMVPGKQSKHYEAPTKEQFVEQPDGSYQKVDVPIKQTGYEWVWFGVGSAILVMVVFPLIESRFSRKKEH